jgi:Fe-S oxidoreductase
MDGSCDISCKAWSDIEPLETMHELRIKCIEDGQILPEHMLVIDGLKKEDNMMLGKKTDRGKWAEGIAVKDLSKEKAKVAYRAGCRYSFDEELWPVVRTGLKLLINAGIDVGISGATQHLTGMSGSKKVITVNKNEEAPIFKASDYGVVGLLEEVVPGFVRKLEELT